MDLSAGKLGSNTPKAPKKTSDFRGMQDAKNIQKQTNWAIYIKENSEGEKKDSYNYNPLKFNMEP